MNYLARRIGAIFFVAICCGGIWRILVPLEGRVLADSHSAPEHQPFVAASAPESPARGSIRSAGTFSSPPFSAGGVPPASPESKTASGTAPSALETQQRIDTQNGLLRVTVRSGNDGYPIREEELVDPHSGAVMKSERMVANRLVLGFDPAKGSSLQVAYLQKLGLKVSSLNPRLGLIRVELSSLAIAAYDSLKTVLAERTELFKFVESEYLQDHSALPNDPYLTSSGSWGLPIQDTWGLHFTGVPAVWEATGTLPTVLVAVIDTGVDLAHAELTGKLWQNPVELAGNGLDDDGNGKVDDVNGWNFVSSNGDVTDVDGHGTAVAGVIAAVQGNATGIAGVAPNARLMMLKTSNQGDTSTYDSAQAIEYAVQKGAKVINMSFGSSSLSYTLDLAVGHARSAGAVLVASAGNSGQYDATNFPSGYPGVLSVGSFSADGRRSTFSNYGPEVDLMAPGEQILCLKAAGTIPSVPVGSNLRTSSGTSFSAPFVSGLASLVLGRHPEYTADQVQARLQENAVDLGATGWDIETGRGGVSATTVMSDNPPVVVDITTPSNGSFAAGTTAIRGNLATAGTISAVLSLSSVSSSPMWTQLGTITSKGANILLGNLATGSYPDGTYVLRLKAQSGGTSVDDYQVLTIGNTLPTITQVNSEDSSRKASADLDGDGKAEVMNASFRRLAVYSGETGVSLPGWPQTALLAQYGHNYGVPAIADLDADGKKEIGLFFAPQNNQWGDSVFEIFKMDGTRAPGWPKAFHNGRTINNQVISPVFADIDADGVSEVVYVQSNDSQAIIQVLNLNGTSSPGWPVTLPVGSVASYATPAVADMDGDGRLDIAVICQNGGIYLLHHDGTPFANWPVSHTSSAFTSAFLTAADFDHDANLELFVISAGGKAAIYKRNGSLATGWPRTFSGNLGTPAIGNIYGDAALEIAVGLGSMQYVWTASGGNAPGWPQATSSTLGMPILMDLDNDGDVDIYNTSYGQQLLAWDTTGRSMTELGFPRTTRYYGEANDVAGDFDGDGLIEITADKYDTGSRFLHLKTPMSGRLEHREIHMHPERACRHTSAQLEPLETRIILQKNIPSIRLSISGKGFLQGTQVSLAGVPLVVESVTPESLICLIPNQVPPGSLECTVKDANFGALVLQGRIIVVSSLLTDDDQDGLRNDYELECGLDPFSSLGANGKAGDLDGDGIANGIEFALRATDFKSSAPDALSRLISTGSAGKQFQYSIDPGAGVEPQWSVDLIHWYGASEITSWPQVSFTEENLSAEAKRHTATFSWALYPKVFWRLQMHEP